MPVAHRIFGGGTNVCTVRLGIIAAAAGLAVVISALALFAAPAAHADVDPTDYYAELRRDGFLVDGNESYLLNLATIVCDMENAGYRGLDIAEYIQRRENLTFHQADQLEILASTDVCTQLHPQLVPRTPSLPPGYSDGD